MTTFSLVLRLLSAAGWGLLILGGLVLDGFQSGILPMVGLLALSLIPHHLLLRMRIVFVVVLAVSILPVFEVFYMILTMRPVSAESAAYKIWVAAGLTLAIMLLSLLPVSLLLSYFGARGGRKIMGDHAA